MRTESRSFVGWHKLLVPSGRINYRPRHWKYFCCRSDSTLPPCVPNTFRLAIAGALLSEYRHARETQAVIEVYSASNWTIISLVVAVSWKNSLRASLVSRGSEQLRNCPKLWQFLPADLAWFTRGVSSREAAASIAPYVFSPFCQGRQSGQPRRKKFLFAPEDLSAILFSFFSSSFDRFGFRKREKLEDIPEGRDFQSFTWLRSWRPLADLRAPIVFYCSVQSICRVTFR